MRRNHLTVRISFDEGLSWPQYYAVDKAPDGSLSEFTAYSDISAVTKNEIGVLYERNDYKEIAFTIVRWK